VNKGSKVMFLHVFKPRCGRHREATKACAVNVI
jgi:hypothetical protein